LRIVATVRLPPSGCHRQVATVSESPKAGDQKQEARRKKVNQHEDDDN
jgi:hypothetical protein